MARWLAGTALSDDVRAPLVLVGVATMFGAAYLLRDVLIPFTIALLLTYLLRPAVVVLEENLGFALTCFDAACCLRAYDAAGRGWARLTGAVPCSCCSPRRRHKDGSSAHSDSDSDDDNTGSGGGKDVEAGGGAGGAAASGASEPEAALLHRSGSGGEKPASPAKPHMTSRVMHSVSCVRLTAVLLATALLVGVLVVLVLIVADSIQTFQQQYWDVFSKQFDVVMRRLVAWIRTNLHADASSLLTAADSLVKELSSTSTLMGIAAALLSVVVTLLLMMFLLLDKRFDMRGHALLHRRWRDAADAAAGAPRRRRRHQHGSAVWLTIDEAVHRYIVTKTLLSLAMGVLVYVILGPTLHVKLAHLFGVLTFVLNFIPNVGAVVAAVVPLPVILLDPALSATAQTLAILLPLGIHFAIGSFVEPFVLGPLLSLHPVVVLFALAFWYVLWGVAGAILAVPITSVLVIAVKQASHPYATAIVAMLEEFRLDTASLSGGGGNGGGAPPPPPPPAWWRRAMGGGKGSDGSGGSGRRHRPTASAAASAAGSAAGAPSGSASGSDASGTSDDEFGAFVAAADDEGVSLSVTCAPSSRTPGVRRRG